MYHLKHVRHKKEKIDNFIFMSVLFLWNESNSFIHLKFEQIRCYEVKPNSENDQWN
jgi:hypothetical protein